MGQKRTSGSLFDQLSARSTRAAGMVWPIDPKGPSIFPLSYE